VTGGCGDPAKADTSDDVEEEQVAKAHEARRRRGRGVGQKERPPRGKEWGDSSGFGREGQFEEG
jgi:hypothetical protein